MCLGTTASNKSKFVASCIGWKRAHSTHHCWSWCCTHTDVPLNLQSGECPWLEASTSIIVGRRATSFSVGAVGQALHRLTTTAGYVIWALHVSINW